MFSALNILEVLLAKLEMSKKKNSDVDIVAVEGFKFLFLQRLDKSKIFGSLIGRD